VDVDFDSHPKFSRRYRLWGWSEADLRTFFTPALLDFFSERPGWSLEGGGGSLLIRRENRLDYPEGAAPPAVRDVLDTAGGLGGCVRLGAGPERR
jgi:hypothetical protein